MADTTYEWTGGSEGNGLPYPTEDSPPDGAGQIKKLAEEVDGALPYAFITGTDRPDGRGDDVAITGVAEGTKYICTEPENNFGAREWTFIDGGWRCTLGKTEIMRLGARSGTDNGLDSGVSGTVTFQRAHWGSWIRGENIATPSGTWNYQWEYNVCIFLVVDGATCLVLLPMDGSNQPVPKLAFL